MKKLLFALILLVSPLYANPPKVILLDLGGLFYRFSGLSYARKIGIGNILGYMIRDCKNPGKMKDVIFGVLDAIPQEEIAEKSDEFKNSLLYKLRSDDNEGDVDVPKLEQTCSSSGTVLPYIICAYQAGHITDKVALEIALGKLQELDEGGEYFVSSRQVNIVKSAINLIFNPEVNAAMNNALPNGMKLLKELAAQTDEDGKKKYLIVALSNVDKYSNKYIEERWPKEIFDHFDHIFYSGDIGSIKPNNDAYEVPYEVLNNEIEAFKENPIKKEDVILLYDQRENIKAARALGIPAILYKNSTQARKELEKRGVLPHRPANNGLALGAVVGGASVIGYLAYLILS